MSRYELNLTYLMRIRRKWSQKGNFRPHGHLLDGLIRRHRDKIRVGVLFFLFFYLFFFPLFSRAISLAHDCYCPDKQQTW